MPLKVADIKNPPPSQLGQMILRYLQSYASADEGQSLGFTVQEIHSGIKTAVLENMSDGWRLLAAIALTIVENKEPGKSNDEAKQYEEELADLVKRGLVKCHELEGTTYFWAVKPRQLKA